MNVRNSCKYFMYQEDYNQSRLAEECKISYASLTMIMQGRDIRVSTLEKLARGCNVSVSHFIAMGE